MDRVVLEVDRVSKRYRRARSAPLDVLIDVQLTLSAGEILPLIGSNGAGKTTLLKIIASLIEPDAGEVRVGGRHALRDHAARAQVGYASGEDRSFYQRLTGRQNLHFFGALYGLSPLQVDHRIEALDVGLDLRPFIDVRVDTCSAGMRARLGLARAALHAPKLLLLDEPTKTLDPTHTGLVEDAVESWARAGAAVIIATHSPAQARRFAERTALLSAGVVRIAEVPRAW